MVDTIRTDAVLISSLFEDNQAPGSITAQDMRDVIVSKSHIYSVQKIYSAQIYGAIGDGASHPASAVFGSLAACQAVYGVTLSGVTVALTQEMDWLGTQLAINTANAAGGGIVQSNGNFVYTNSNSVSDGSGTLNFPSATPYSPSGSVSWRGQGYGYTHRWPNDLGSGRFAVLCGGRTNSSSIGFFDNLYLIGPGNGTTLGTSGCSMQGIGTNDRRQIVRCSIGGFWAGINIVGGQFVWQDVTIGAVGSNYYGVYFDNPQSTNYGNMQFIRVLMALCNKACIGVHHAAAIPASHFLSCFLGTSPYALFKETNSGSPTQPIVVSESKFELCQFEAIGNALVCDDRTTQAARVVIVYETTLEQCQFAWSGTYKISGLSNFAIIDVKNIQGSLRIIDPISASSWTPGTASLFSVSNSCQGLYLSGDVNGLLAGCVAATGGAANQFNADANMPVGGDRARLENSMGGYWRGCVAFNRDTTAVVGSVVIYNAAYLHCIASAGTTSDAPLGVIMYNPTPGVAFSTCVIADEGYVTVKVSGTVTIGQWLRTAAGGLAIAASGSNDTTSPMIGIAMTSSSGGICTVKLKGLS